MWTRAELKSRAKYVLGSSYWKAFVVSLIVMLAGGSSKGGGSSGSQYRNHVPSGNPEFAQRIAFIIAMVVLAFLVFRIIIGFCLEVGGRKYFIRSAEGNVNLAHVGHVFQSGAYGNVTLTMLWKGILTFLWTLLLIIPGIIASYAYRMVPYILADNPYIGTSRAIELSRQMMDGEKLDTWVLDLSFIGWYLLGALLFGVGILFVQPYEDSTNAELYLTLRQKALEQGMCSSLELNLIPPFPSDQGNTPY